MMYLLAPAFVRHGDRSACQLKAMYDILKALPSSPGICSVDLRHGLHEIKTAVSTLKTSCHTSSKVQHFFFF